MLNDKRHIITCDTEANVALYDVLKVVKVDDLGQVDFDEEVKKRNQRVYIPNWFTVDLKIGVRYNTNQYIFTLSWFFTTATDANYRAGPR